MFFIESVSSADWYESKTTRHHALAAECRFVICPWQLAAKRDKLLWKLVVSSCFLESPVCMPAAMFQILCHGVVVSSPPTHTCQRHLVLSTNAKTDDRQPRKCVTHEVVFGREVRPLTNLSKASVVAVFLNPFYNMIYRSLRHSWCGSLLKIGKPLLDGQFVVAHLKEESEEQRCHTPKLESHYSFHPQLWIVRNHFSLGQCLIGCVCVDGHPTLYCASISSLFIRTEPLL